jgi:hypothetical protein
MSHSKATPIPWAGKGNQTRSAHTLLELMVASGIFSLVVIGMLYAHLFGMRQDELIQSKLGASESSRRSFNQFMQDMRMAKIWRVGNVPAGSPGTNFSAVATNALQIGNAVKISLSIDTSKYIVYYYNTSDPNNNQLCRMQSGVGSSSIIASNLINTFQFSAEDYLGNVKSTLSYKYVVHTTLQLEQFQYPLTKVGSNYLYDFYKIDLRATPHCPDGT